MTENPLLTKTLVELKKGFSKPLILFALDKDGSYPYPLIKRIDELSNGKITIAGSNIYPMLKNLERENLIAYKMEENRKFYYLTERGKLFIKELDDEIQDFLKTILRIILSKHEDTL